MNQEETNPLLSNFFNAVETWRREVSEHLDEAYYYLTVAEEKPLDARHFPYMYLDNQNAPWIKWGSVWCKLVRASAKPFAHYKPEPMCVISIISDAKEIHGPQGRIQSLMMNQGRQVDFVKCARDFPEEDWGWELPSSSLVRRTPEWHFVTQKMLEDSVERDKRGEEFGHSILERKTQLCNWILGYGSSGLLHPMYSWRNFCEFLSGVSPLELPGTIKLESALATVLIELAKPK